MFVEGTAGKYRASEERALVYRGVRDRKPFHIIGLRGSVEKLIELSLLSAAFIG